MLTNDQLDIRFDAVGGGHAARSEIHIDAGHAASVAVPDAHLLFGGEYHRVGSDLQISDADLRLTIHDYFRAERRPSLVAPNGATLADDVVAALATSDIGERYAQLGAGAASAQIGRVETMTGSASAVRNGVSVELHPGDPVLKGDAVQTGTGSSLGISFIDGTIFSLSASARMVLNDMVYQAGGTGNSAALTLVQGSIGFLAGQVAKTGNMQVGTPVATMGIRGTLVFTENPPTPTGNTITSVDGVVSFSIGRESDGRVGIYQVTPLSGPSLTVNDPSLITYVTPGGSVSQDPKPDAVLQAEILLTQQIYQIASLAQANQPGVPNSGPQGGGGPGSSTPPDINGGSSTTSGGPGNGQPTNPGGHDIQAPNFNSDPAPPPANAQQTIPLGQSAPGIPGTPNGTTGAGQPSDTGNGQSITTPSTPPPLASQTVPLGQNQSVAVTTQRAGLLYSGGADAATVAAEHVSFVEPGARDDANHVAVDAGRDGTYVAGDYGTLTIHQDGTYSYFSLRSTPLAEGEIGLDRFTYTVVNADGQSSLATLTFRITGANDTPVAASDSAAVGGGNTVAATTRAAGLLGNDTDPDHNETSTLHITAIGAGTTAAAVGGTGTTTLHGQYGTLTVSADGTYSYVQDATSPLGPGQVGVERFSYTVEDNHGAADQGAANGTFTIQVTGAGPFLDLDTSDGSAQTNFTRTYAGAGTLLASPNVAITDPDRTTLNSATITLTQGGNRDTQDTLSIDSATLARDHLLFSGGSGTYTLTTMPGASASDSDYADALQHVTFVAGDSATTRDVTASIQVSDGTRASNIAASTIHLGATSFSGTDSGSVTEAGYMTDGTPTSTGTLHDSLADGRTDAFQPVATAATSSNGYGSYTVTDSGTWTYALDNANGTVQALGANQTASDTITLTAADGVTHAVTITIQGTDDAPVTQSDTNSVSVASGTTTVTGNVLSNDGDPEGDTLTVTGLHNDAAGPTSFTAVGTYGTLTVNQDGTYSYVAGTTADQAAADQALGEGSPGTDQFTYTASDPSGATSDNTLTITVYGVDDAPTVRTANTVASYILGNGAVQVDPSLQLSDPDNPTIKSAQATVHLGSGTFVSGDTLSIPVGDYGSFHVDSSSTKLVFTDGAILDQSYSSESYTLVLATDPGSPGDASVADIQSALQQVRFSAGSDVADTRIIDFSASDGSLTSGIASGRATVSNPNPTAADDFFTVAQNTSHFGTLPAASDSGSTYTIEQPLHGTIAESGTTYVYTPTADYVGSDSFVYRVTDSGGTHAYSVTVGVQPNAGIEFGFSLANLGDIDSNGLSDEGTGAPGDPQGGVAFISQYGTTGTGAFGYALANVGDLTHTGIASTAVGAPLDTIDGAQTGDVYVYHHTNGTNDNGLALDFKIIGAANGDRAGAALGSAGYFHEDSSQSGATPDIVVGAPGANSAYVVYGNVTHDTDGNAIDVELGDLSGRGIVIHDATTGDQFGFAVAGGGDYRASTDHHADIIVGAPGTANSEGAAYVIFGSDAPADIADISSGSFNGFKITGAATGDQFGYSVAHLGDVNGDGYDDFAIGAPGTIGLSVNGTPGPVGAGAVYVVYGSDSLASVSLSALESGSGGFVVHGSVAGGHLGYSVASAGDVDGDGRDDILIGAPNVSSNEKIDNGVAYLVLGSQAGTFSVSDRNVVLTGDRPGNELGSSVATTGDSSGSGLAGFAAGAPHSYDAISNTANSGYYVSTSHNAANGLVQGTSGNDNGASSSSLPALTGNTTANKLDGLQGDDRIVGFGGGDHLIGGSGADTFVFSAGDTSGRNTIADFHTAQATATMSQRDNIEIDGYVNIVQFDDLRSHLSAVNSHDTLIDLGTDHTILLKNVAILSLGADDFSFHSTSG